jgi:hypothetical protein
MLRNDPVPRGVQLHDLLVDDRKAGGHYCGLDVMAPARELASAVDFHVVSDNCPQFVKVPGCERTEVPAHHIDVMFVRAHRPRLYGASVGRPAFLDVCAVIDQNGIERGHMARMRLMPDGSAPVSL